MDSAPEPARVARFGHFEVDFRSGELHKNGRKIRLQEQPLQILALLLAHPGEVVTRDELHRRLWPQDTFVDFDHGLNNAINRLREALADSAENPRYVETLPRRGYRFVAEVETIGEEQTPATNVFPGGDFSPTGFPWVDPSRRAVLNAVVAILVVVAIAGWMLGRGGRSSSASTPAIHSVAVLPLENLTGDASKSYLADGITDALTTELAQLQAWEVTSRTSSMQFKKEKKPISQIRSDLKVDAVVEGSVQTSGQNLVINIQLIEASSDRHLWARSYQTSEIAGKEQQIVRDMLRELNIHLTSQEKERLDRERSVLPVAHDYYLRARVRYLLENEEDNREAIRLLEQSVAIDPGFAPAHTSLAMAYRIRAFSLVPAPQQKEWEDKASASIDRALSIEPDLAEAYVARGYLLWSLSNKFSHERAIKDYKRALELNPSCADAHHQLANIFNHIGLLDKGRIESQKAVELDPLNVAARFRVGINFLYDGRYKEALEALRDSERFHPSLWAFQTAHALFQLDRKAEAANVIQDSLQKHTEDVDGLLSSMRALLSADAGDTHSAETYIREAIQKGRKFQHFHHVGYMVASAYARMNRIDSALQYLKIAANEGFPCYPLFERDHNLDPLRKDPRFVAFLAEQKAQWEYFKFRL